MGTRSHHCYSHSLGEQVRRGRVSFNLLILNEANTDRKESDPRGNGTAQVLWFQSGDCPRE